MDDDKAMRKKNEVKTYNETLCSCLVQCSLPPRIILALLEYRGIVKAAQEYNKITLFYFKPGFIQWIKVNCHQNLVKFC